MKKYKVKAIVVFETKMTIEDNNKLDACELVKDFISLKELCNGVIDERGIVVNVLSIERKK